MEDMKFQFSYWICQTIAMMLTALLLPKLRITSFIGALAAVTGLARVNAHLWSTAAFFSVPDSVTLHAITLLAVNGIIFWLVIKFAPGIEIDGILTAFIAPVIFTITSLFISRYGQNVNWIQLLEQSLDFFPKLRSLAQS